jgi:hypothetical protein
MSNPKLKIIANKINSPQDPSIADRIGRDASPVLKLTPPVFDCSAEVRASCWNNGLKWMGLQRPL